MTAMTGDKGGVIRDPPPAPIGWLNISAQIGLNKLTMKGYFPPFQHSRENTPSAPKPLCKRCEIEY